MSANEDDSSSATKNLFDSEKWLKETLGEEAFKDVVKRAVRDYSAIADSSAFATLGAQLETCGRAHRPARTLFSAPSGQLSHLRPDPEAAQLRRKTAEREEELAQRVQDLSKQLETDADAHKVQLDQLAKDYAELQKEKDLGYLLGRVCEAAQKRLMHDPAFAKDFERSQCDAFVLSIDIRRSTDLMLRGKTPVQYAEFLDVLCRSLASVIKDSLGVMDKFTGDGILAYFPTFYSGPHAGLRALQTAQQCHRIFARYYKEARNSFTVALEDVGLGIGIDSGDVHLMRVTGELTVVGPPVVYACRLSGAPAGHTYLNHPAFAELITRWPEAISAAEVKFPLKHEGVVYCYDAEPVPEEMPSLALPEWLKVAAEPKPEPPVKTSATDMEKNQE